MRALLLAAVLGGCASYADTSYVAPLAGPGDARVLAAAIVDFIGSHIPASSPPVALDPPAGGGTDDITPAIRAALETRGVRLGAPGTPDALQARYWVTPMGAASSLVRVSLAGGATEGNRVFVRDAAGKLQPGGPFTIKTTQASR